jgi:hypothetical protein
MAGVAASDSGVIGFDNRISASNQTLTLHPPANPCHALNKMVFCNGPSWVNPFRAISLYFFHFFVHSVSGSVDAAFSRPGLQLYPAWHRAAVNDGCKATGAAGA